MPDNVKQEKVEENTNSTRKENGTIDEYRKEINKVQNDAEKGINSFLEEARKNLDEGELFKKFIVENPGIKANSIDDLAPEDKSKYEKYVNDETDKSYEKTKNGIIQKTKERMKKLDDIGSRLDKLEEESKSKLDDLIKERDELPVDDPKRKDLDNQISDLQSVISGIGEKRKKELLKKYKNISKMKEATKEELEEILPVNVANEFYEFLKEYD